ncbi:MAG: hypothetical protein ACKV22_19255 [Bryobacteraceae bacterium]
MQLRWLFLLAAAAASPAETTHLFWNWGKVDPGDTKFPLDRTQIGKDSLGVLEKVGRYYRIELADGLTPPHRFNTASGVRIAVEKARKIGPWLKPDQPWEVMGINQGTVLHDSGKFRLWYACSYERGRVIQVAEDRYKLEYGQAMCYAESDDGMTWRKPALGLVEFRGSTQNNIVSKDPRIEGGTVFIDPTARPEERYKLISPTSLRAFEPKLQTNAGVLAGAVSGDGIHWKPLPEPLWKGHISDTYSGITYDEKLARYVGFFRTSHGRRRSIGRSETADFAHWPIPSTILTPAADEMPSDDFYSNGYSVHPGVPDGHLILCSIYHRDISALDVRLATSLDGVTWNWTSRETIIERGAAGAWDGGSLYVSPQMVRLPDGRVAVPLAGYSHLHNEFWRIYYQEGYPNTQGFGWAVWQDGRLAGIEARQKGEFTTLPLTAAGGEIRVNARTNTAGSIRVELIVEEGGAAKIFRAKEITGDRQWTPLDWEDPVDLRSLAGKPVRLRFLLYDAKVFGVRL